MVDRLVVNTSPLIFLSKIQCLHGLSLCCKKHIIIPQAVITELLAGQDGKEIVAQIQQHKTFHISENSPISPIVAVWDLGAGETQVINTCLNQTIKTAIMDDLAARHCGESLGLKVIGTLGIVLAMKQQGHLKEIRPIIEQLLHNGLYLSQTLVENVLKQVNE